MNNKRQYKKEQLSLDNESLMLDETIFANANGYIGVRSAFEEGYPEGLDSIRGSYINGFYDFAEMKQAEKLCGLVEEKQTMLNVADTQGIRLVVEGEEFSLFQGEVQEYSRTLDMDAGVSERYMLWRSPGGRTVEIRIKRMTSFCQLPLFTVEYTVKAVDFTGELKLLSDHIADVRNYSNPDDPRVAGESFVHLKMEDGWVEDEVTYLLSSTVKSKLHVCTAVAHEWDGEGTHSVVLESGAAHHQIAGCLNCGESLTVRKYSVFCDSLRYPDCTAAAAAEMKKARAVSLAEHYRLQQEYLRKFWEQSDLEIDGDEELGEAVRYNLYQLLQHVGKDSCSNMAAKGLSGEGYEGHYFWDTEMYIQPFFTLTNPEISRNLISYRYGILDAARENARILGHEQGALYPWRTIMGKECSGYYPSGTAQYHINSDVAYAVTAYYLATDDLEFMEEKGAEILIETARLWMDVGCYYDGSFRIHAVTGPDEYTCMVNNNYYTNVSAAYNLCWGGKVYEQLREQGMAARLEQKLGVTQQEAAEFSRAADCMYLPYDERLGITPQDDSFLQKPVWDLAHTPADKFPLLLHYHPLHLYRYQVCKQADTVLAHFLFEDVQPAEVVKASYEYYEKITTHDSSLSTCMFSAAASRLGMQEKAYEYFGDSAKLDLFNTHHNTKDGIHTANMGGNYMAIVYGFGGLRLKETGLSLDPYLPKAWNGYRFKVVYRGSRIQVQVAERAAKISLLDGPEKDITVYGKVLRLRAGAEISCSADVQK